MALFIAFEGIDGSGKSTQFQKFAEYLFKLNKYNNLVLTRNPYKDNNIRAVLKESNNPLETAEKLADLFIQDRTFQSKELIIPSLEKGLFVITDRFKLSTITYQSAQGIDMNKLIEKSAHLPSPNITFIVDIPAKDAAERMKQDPIERNKFETNIDFLENVRQNFLKAAQILKNEKIIIINGNQTAEKVFEEIILNFNLITTQSK